MLRDFFSYGEIPDVLGIDKETFRQQLLRGRFAGYIEIEFLLATYDGLGFPELEPGTNIHAEWRKQFHRDEDEPQFWTLRGWFRLLPETLVETVRADKFGGIFGGDPTVELWPWGVTHQQDPDNKYIRPAFVLHDLDDTRMKLPRLKDLWFSSEEVMAEIGKSVDKEDLDPRERNNLHRIVRALAEMAKLRKGSAAAIEKQLQLLGFAGPKEATIRKVLDEAKALQPDNTQQANAKSQ